MADRQRTTWQGSGDKAATSSQPVLPVERARAASAHPATPDEGAAHPAHQPDPTQPADYKNGDTSSWAEDPTKGPYPNSAHPATPDEGAAHPAHKQSEMAPNEPGGQQITNADLGVSKAAAKELRAAVERKAAKCIRIASKLLGVKATVAAVEDQALDFMDMSDVAIQTTLGRLAAEESDEDASDDEDDSKKAGGESDEDASDDEDEGKKAADEKLLRRLLAEEEDEDDSDKEASQDLTASEQILAAIAGLGSRIDALETGKTSASDDDVLAGLLAEEEAPVVAMDEGVEDDVEALLMSMIDDDEGDVAGCGDEMAMDDSYGMDDGSLGIDMGLVEDPMGLLGEVELEGDEEALLAQLFADSRMASDDDEDEDEDEGKQAAARLPRPKKASASGATRLGRVTKEAGSDIRELEKLWPTAPDVTGVFG